MTGNTFFWLTSFTFIILTFSVHGKPDIEAALDMDLSENVLKEVIRKLLKEEVEKLKERDVESDIADIKKILDSYGEDLTSLRINQGHIVDSVDEHSISLANNAEKFASHDQLFIEQQTFMEENRAIIDSHTLIVNDHQGFIQANIESITNNTNRIQENANGIVKNAQDIQAVLDNFNNYKNSQVKFYVQTSCCDGTEYNPENVCLTYPIKYLDTHNAVSDSQFFPPISGVYGFIFTADFRIWNARPNPGLINVNINNALAKVFVFDLGPQDDFQQSFSIFFSLVLNQGDQVDISTSGDPIYNIARNPATLMGYLMQ